MNDYKQQMKEAKEKIQKLADDDPRSNPILLFNTPTGIIFLDLKKFKSQVLFLMKGTAFHMQI